MDPLTHEAVEQVNREAHLRLYAMADELCHGEISLEEYVRRMLEAETWLRGAGFWLLATHTIDDWNHVALRAPGEKVECLVFQFHPTTCEFREEEARYPVRSAAPAGGNC